MLDIFVRIFDTILPPHKSVLILRNETPEKFKRFYLPQKLSHSTSLADYSEIKIRMAITANKFHNHQKASRLLASLIELWLTKQTNKNLIFIPIPLGKKRQKERGFNQVTRILENVNNHNLQIENLLIRTRDTTPQTQLDRSLRFQNVTGVFSLQKQTTLTDLENYHLILIDDVITTGATMKEAYDTLKANLPTNTEVTCLALAH